MQEKEKPNISFDSLGEGSKATGEDTITVTNLQDQFFNKLPLQSPSEISFSNPSEGYPPRNYTPILRRKSGPIIMKGPQPFWQSGLSTEGRGVRAKSIDGAIQDFLLKDKGTKVKYERSTLGIKPQEQFARRILKNSMANQLSRTSFVNPIQKDEFDFKTHPHYKTIFQQPNENGGLLLQKPLTYIRHRQSPFLVLPIQPYYSPQIIQHSLYPIQYLRNPLSSFYKLNTPPLYSLLFISKYSSHIFQPLNNLYKEEHIIKNIENSSANDSKSLDDSIDYLLLSDEFSKVNGSITNDPAFGNIKDLQKNKANTMTAKLALQDQLNMSQMTHRSPPLNPIQSQIKDSLNITANLNEDNKNEDNILDSFILSLQKLKREMKQNSPRISRKDYEATKLRQQQ